MPVLKLSELDDVWHTIHVVELSHMRSIDKLFPFIRERYYFKSIRAWLKMKLNDCSCVTRSKVSKISYKPLHPVSVPMEPGTLYGLDTIKNLPTTKKGHTGMMTLCDYTSGKGFAYPLKTEEIPEVIFCIWMYFAWYLFELL